MSLALRLAQASQQSGDVPVGAVVVCEGRVVGQAGNARERHGDPTAHAEVLALQSAARELGSWNLSRCTLYVTLEPCPMCLGAALLARIGEVVCGCRNHKLGAAGSVLPLHDFPGLSLRCRVRHGVLEEPCARLVTDFFRVERRSGEVAEPG